MTQRNGKSMGQFRESLVFLSTFITVFAFMLFLGAGPAQALSDAPDQSAWVTDGGVYTILPGTTTYIGGAFTYVGPPTGAFAALDGSTGLASTPYLGVDGIVYAALSDGAGGWYIGGSFKKVGGTARNNLAHILSDGTVDPSWNPDVNGTVSAMAIGGSTLYVGGAFTSVGSQSRKNLAALNAATGVVSGTWAPDANDAVNALVVNGSTVYVGGNFTSIGHGSSRKYIAALTTTLGGATSWNPDANDGVQSLALSGSTIYAGGYFTSIGGQARNRIAALEAGTGLATSWNPNADEVIYSLVVSGSTIYAGGYFTSIGGQARSGLAALEAGTGLASAWNPGPSYNLTRPWISAIFVSGPTVYVGGQFNSIGGQTRKRIAALDGDTGLATPVDLNAGGPVYTLTLNASKIYAGGDFTSVGGRTRNHLAALDESGTVTSWNPNADKAVYALAIGGTTIYAGGVFTSVGGETRNYIAAIAIGGTVNPWDPQISPSSWTNTPAPGVYTLFVDGSTVLAGGNFTTVGAKYRFGIVDIHKDSGLATDWDPQTNGIVYKILVNGAVYVGGDFGYIGGKIRNGLASLEPTTAAATDWDPNPNEGGGGASVSTIAVDGTTVYVGGNFASLGGQPRNSLAAVNVTTGLATPWNPNSNDAVSVIAVNGSTVYVGGNFTSIGGQTRNHVAALEAGTGLATSWNPNAVGETAPYVAALGFNGSTLYVGGEFDSLGGSALHAHFARFGNTATLTVAPLGTGSGSVTSEPGGISCGSSCSASFLQDTTVTLTAVAGAGSVFSGWSGGVCSGTGQCVVTMTSDVTVSATFAADVYTVNASVSGGHGSAKPDTQTVSYGASASISFTPDKGYHIASITDNGLSKTIANPYVISNVHENHTVVVTFSTGYTVTVVKTGNGTGTVTSSPKGISCGATCHADFKAKARVTLTAKPDTDALFGGWSGPCTGTKTTCTITITDTATVAANFIGDPKISVTPASKNFGKVPVKQTRIQVFTVKNTGGKALAIGSLTLTGSPFFTKSVDKCSNSGLAKNKSCTFRMTYKPTNALPVLGTVTIPSNDPATSSFNIALSGNTAAAGRMEE